MLVLPSELTHVQARAALNLLLQAARAEAGEQVCVDAGALARFDSSALAVLLEVRRACLRERKSFVVRDLGARLRTLARLYGVDGLLPAAPAMAPTLGEHS
ncbi:MAG TPA: STAS domain-containing protein [Ottowia sp.]|uniref:STAS domain-containing protein n=1 Tax=Ottowia sp. TaxID=1898956 RepID=UPI002CE0AA63|nr:STAS domain-containing protein [Ottowia sp.]HMN19915.1 STAS domain-containing protein [Ottowia sp.]